MSKENPEVGDVFFDNRYGLSLVVTFKKYGIIFGLWATGQSFSFNEKYLKDFGYIGKTKANIDDLFEVKND
jgi:hypothetical protein